MTRYSQFLRKNERSILFWVFITVSFPLAIIVLGYAAGYKIDTDTKTVVESSALAIETQPKDAIISLNNQIQEKQSPYVSTLSPGIYNVEVTKQGYQSWSKQVTFEQGKSIIFPDIILFKQGVPIIYEQALPSMTNSITPSKQNTKLYYQEIGWNDTEQLYELTGPINLLVNRQTQTSYLLPSLTEFNNNLKIDAVVKYAEWLDQKALLLVTENELWVYNVELSKLTLLNRQSKTISSATWHPEGGYIFYGIEDGLFAIELDPRDQRQIWKLSQLSNPSQLQINSQGDRLYFTVESKLYEYQVY